MSTGLVLEAFVQPAHTPLKSSRTAAVDNPPKDALFKLASSFTLPQILERVVELFLLQERENAHRRRRLGFPTVHRQRLSCKLQSRVQRP